MRNVKDANGMPFASMLIDIAKQGGAGSSLRYTFLSSSADPTPIDKVGLGPRLRTVASDDRKRAQYISSIDASFWSMVRTASIVIVVLMLLSIAIAWMITRSVVKPLTGLRERMASLSDRRIRPRRSPIPIAAMKIGQMARTVGVFRDAMIETNRLREEQAAVEAPADRSSARPT